MDPTTEITEEFQTEVEELLENLHTTFEEWVWRIDASGQENAGEKVIIRGQNSGRVRTVRVEYERRADDSTVAEVYGMNPNAESFGKRQFVAGEESVVDDVDRIITRINRLAEPNNGV